MIKPLLSIITVVYNGKDYLESTIKSIINQKSDRVEYIIIDGGSTDGTLEIIDKYKYLIDYWISEPDRGIYDAMNKGIAKATGKYLLFLNAQDELVVSLENIKEYLEQDFALIYGKANYVDDAGNKCIIGKEITDAAIFFDYMPTCHQSILYNRAKIFKYNLDFRIIADRIFTYELITKNPSDAIKFIEEPICTYYSGGFSDKHNLLFIEEKFKFRKQYHQIKPKDRIIYFLNYFIRYRLISFIKLDKLKVFQKVIKVLK